MKFLILITTFIFLTGNSFLRGEEIILSRLEAEQIFLEENLLLIAEKLQIDQAEAMILQARLWPNPTLEVDEVNLWATEHQLSMGESLPPFNESGFGKNRQISAQLEQVILTAGKRKKRIAMEEVSRDMAKVYFEELLRDLRIQFRENMTQLQYLQSFYSIFVSQVNETSQLLKAYERQYDQGNIDHAELLRLKALAMEMRNESRKIKNEMRDLQKELIILMNLPSGTKLSISEDSFIPEIPETLLTNNTHELISLALENHSNMKLARLELDYFDKMYRYERSLAIPDVSLSGGYDRGGNFLYNFIGFGIAFDIPVFNRNQGQIQYAKIGVERSSLLIEEQQKRIETEVITQHEKLVRTVDFYNSIDKDFSKTLERSMKLYTKNFAARNIGLIEYLDFFHAYLDNKEMILSTIKELNLNLEELKYVIGEELHE